MSSNGGGSRRPRLISSGDELIAAWQIPARQARFHRDGHWYDLPNKFPAALCDCRGYLVFHTEDELRRTPGVNLGKQANVPAGVCALEGYRTVDNPLVDPRAHVRAEDIDI